MPTPSKFNQGRRTRILELLGAGASRREAARATGIDHATLHRWIERGRRAAHGSRWRRFFLEVVAAEADPRIRALERAEAPFGDDPLAAWRYLEHSGELATDPAPLPTIIQLTLGRPPRPEDDQDDDGA